MTWHYKLDEANDRIRLRYEDDSGTVHGPRDVAWPGSSPLRVARDGWVTQPNVKEEAGRACTDLYTNVGVETALMALRDLAAGQVVEGTP